RRPPARVPGAAGPLAGRRLPGRRPHALPLVRRVAGAGPRRGARLAVALLHVRGGAELRELRGDRVADPGLDGGRHVGPPRARPGLGRAAARVGRRPARRAAGGADGADRMSLADVPWRTCSSRVVYRNPWIRVEEDQGALPDGRTTVYGVVRCVACVGVLPFLGPETVVLIRQYRYVARGVFWEMPTGGVHPGEGLEAAAQRELGEEIGYRAARLTPIVSYHTSKSVVDETA